MTAKDLALKDISDYLSLKDNKNCFLDSLYIYSANRLDTKENVYLNKKLGINKLNYFGNKNGLKSKTNVK